MGGAQDDFTGPSFPRRLYLGGGAVGGVAEEIERGDGGDPGDEPIIQVEGFDVKVTAAGRLIVTMVDGHAMPVTVEVCFASRMRSSVIFRSLVAATPRPDSREMESRIDSTRRAPGMGMTTGALASSQARQTSEMVPARPPMTRAASYPT